MFNYFGNTKVWYPCHFHTGFLRYNELSNIKANIAFHEDYVNIFIVKSKTDCSRNDKNVVISKLDSLQCPLNILRCYLEEAYVEINIFT
jgi:hypothetical protein